MSTAMLDSFCRESNTGATRSVLPAARHPGGAIRRRADPLRLRDVNYA